MKNKFFITEKNNYLSFTELEKSLEIIVKAKSDTVLEFTNIKNQNDEVLIIVESECDLKIDLKEDVNLKINLIVKEKLNINFQINRFVKLELNTIIFTNNNIENYFNIDLIGEESEVFANTLDYLNYQAEHKNHIIINHYNKNTFGLMKNNLISKNQGKILLDGISKIIKGAKLSNARQQNRGALLDNVSTIKAIPCLLIDEFDCKASHGAAIGKISDEGLFYLMSRGLSKKNAMNLIINGFIQPFLDKIMDEELKGQLINYFNE